MSSTSGGDAEISDDVLLGAARFDRVRKRELLLGSIIALLIFCLLVISSLYLWGVTFWRGPIDYAVFGNWSEALSGLATTAAVTVALTSLLHERSIRRLAEHNQTLEREAAVYIWLSFTEIVDQAGKRVGRLWDLKIQNLMTAPIYRWSAIFSDGQPHLCGFSARPLLPGENVFNLPRLDNSMPNAVPTAELIFESQSGSVLRRSDKGALGEAAIRSLVCEHWPKAKPDRKI